MQRFTQEHLLERKRRVVRHTGTLLSITGQQFIMKVFLLMLLHSKFVYTYLILLVLLFLSYLINENDHDTAVGNFKMRGI